MRAKPQKHDGFDRLDAERLLETLKKLKSEIEATFPDSGLGRVSATLIRLCGDVRRGAADVRRPYIGLRLIIAAGMAASLWIAASALGITSLPQIGDGLRDDPLDAIQALEALFNGVFLLLAGLLFIIGVEERWKRAKALRVLHRVRSITHVIDMHQLSKDPASVGARERINTAEALVRYLGFCTDLLSVSGKIGALYAQDMSDVVVIDTVNDIETLATICRARSGKRSRLRARS